jgi:hypothetical protein
MEFWLRLQPWRGGILTCRATKPRLPLLRNDMRKHIFISITFFVLALCWSVQADNKSPSAAFKKLQALAGDWEGKDDGGMAAKTSFKLVVADTTVMETLAAHGMEEMLTLYAVDRDGIALVHYCPTNNQPRMRAVPKSENANELDFQFTGAGNLPELSRGHEQRLVMRFEDADHITEEWTWRRNGKDAVTVYHFARISH